MIDAGRRAPEPGEKIPASIARLPAFYLMTMNRTTKFFLIGLMIGCLSTAIEYRSTQIAASAQTGNQVTIINYQFEPKKLTVTEGATVTWINKEGVHTVRSDSDVFISKTLKAGDSFQYQFTKAGTYPYHCSFHGGSGGEKMAGVVVVVKKK
jgi:plastocyanin